MRKWVIIAMMAMAAPAMADSSHTSGGDVTATGGAGGRADSSSVAFGGSSHVDTDVHNTAVSGASSDQKQGQVQGQSQGNNNQIAIGNDSPTVVNPDVHVKYDGRTHAESAPESRGMTTGNDSQVCGAVGGASAQTGVFGGGISSESFACLALKHQLYQDRTSSKLDRVIEGTAWYFPPFVAFRMVRSAVFN